MRKLEFTIVTVLLGWFAAVSFFSQRWSSVTIDEFAHLPAGYYYWLTGDYRLYAKNPPLVKLITSLPLAWKHSSAETDLSRLPKSGWMPWLYGTDFMLRNQGNYLKIFESGRMMVILMGLILGLILYGSARQWYGKTGAVLSLAIFAFCPNLIAHSQLATVDTGASLFILIALLSLVHYLKKPSWSRAALAGLGLATAQLSKFSSVSLLLFYGLAPILAVWPFRSDRASARRFILRICQVGLMIIIWLFLTAACYRFQNLFHTTADFDFHSRWMKRIQAVTAPLPAPFPETYLLGLDRQLEDMQQGEFGNYLLGNWYHGVSRKYFLIALLVKVPIPVMILFLLAMISGVIPGKLKWGFAPEELLIIAVIGWMFLLFSFRNSLQIGVRYLLPMFPLAYLLIGRIGKSLSTPGIVKKMGVAVLVAWLIGECAGTYPHYLSYFNQFAGGPKNGHKVLLDSNLDWGQDLPALAALMKDKKIDKIELWYFGHPSPDLYGVNYQLLGQEPRQKYAAISAQFYYSQGNFHYPLLYYHPLEILFQGKKPIALNKIQILPYLGKKPVALCGSSILVFENE